MAANTPVTDGCYDMIDVLDDPGATDQEKEMATTTIVEAIAPKYLELFNAVVELHQIHGDDLCWMPADINKVFQAAGLPPQDLAVGDKEAMLKNCARYVDCLQSGGPWKSYATLEKEIEMLQAHAARMREMLQWLDQHKVEDIPTRDSISEVLDLPAGELFLAELHAWRYKAKEAVGYLRLAYERIDGLPVAEQSSELGDIAMAMDIVIDVKKGAEATLKAVEAIIPRNEAHRDYAETVQLVLDGLRRENAELKTQITRNELGENRVVVCRGCGKLSKPLKWSCDDDMAKLAAEYATCPECLAKPGPTAAEVGIDEASLRQHFKNRFNCYASVGKVMSDEFCNEMAMSEDRFVEIVTGLMDTQNRAWIEAIHPGNSKTEIGRSYGAPEKYKTFARARLLTEIEETYFYGKIVDAMYLLSEAVLGDREAWVGEEADDNYPGLPKLVEKVKELVKEKKNGEGAVQGRDDGG